MILSMANIRKAKNYLKKNGWKEAFYASAERIYEKKHFKYQYSSPDEEELARQRSRVWKYAPKISIIVPAYETKPVFIEDLILSVMDQTYPNFELIIADASESHQVEKIVKELSEEYDRIFYYRLPENEGISENTNHAAAYATGDYIGLLDHDDLLTPDALYEVASRIEKAQDRKLSPVLIYTDEDKTNTYLEVYYEPNRKPSMDLDLLLTNNYICHFSVYRADVLKSLRLRREYDGAQDYDLVLRTQKYAADTYGINWKHYICHVPRIVYHWRCHEASTAENPAAKMYAYEAGRRAVEDYLASCGIEADVTHLKHLGFYRINYRSGIWSQRKDIGVVGGPVYDTKKGIFGRTITGGAMTEDGKVRYKGIPEHFSGLLHRAVLQQQTQAVDIRNMEIREDLIPLFEQMTGMKYDDLPQAISVTKDAKELEKLRKKSLAFCNKVRERNIGILYDPEKGETSASKG